MDICTAVAERAVSSQVPKGEVCADSCEDSTVSTVVIMSGVCLSSCLMNKIKHFRSEHEHAGITTHVHSNDCAGWV